MASIKPKPLALWIAILWAAMQKTNKGFMHHSLKHTGVDLDRRNDKLSEVPGEDGKTIFVARHERKFERDIRLGKLGVRK